MPPVDATIKVLYQIFTQRFKASDLQKSLDSAVKLGLVGQGTAIQQMRDILEEGTTLVPGAEETLAGIDIQAEDWAARLSGLHGAIILMGPEEVRRPLFDELQAKLPKGLPYIVVGYGTFADAERDEARGIQIDMGLRPFYWIAEIRADKLGPLAEEWAAELEPIGLALGRRLAWFRRGMAKHLTTKISRQNFTIALASSIPSTVPILGLIAGTIAVTGELVVLTSNQLKLCMQIAGMFGLELDFWDRMRELWPVVGSSFGWRQLARGVIGFLPGAGPAIKAVIAYTGTYSVGEGARWYYEKGRKISFLEQREKLAQVRREALEKARGLLLKFKGRRLEKMPQQKPAPAASSPAPEASPWDVEEDDPWNGPPP